VLTSGSSEYLLHIFFSQMDGENRGREEKESKTRPLGNTGPRFGLSLLVAAYADAALFQ